MKVKGHNATRLWCNKLRYLRTFIGNKAKRGRAKPASPIHMTAYTERIRYEVNVSINGWHLFATDSNIRWYKPFQIADMVLVFQERFPEAKILVQAWTPDGHSAVLDPIIEGALSGDIDKDRLAKTIKRFRDQVNKERSDDYVGGVSEAEAIQPV